MKNQRTTGKLKRAKRAGKIDRQLAKEEQQVALKSLHAIRPTRRMAGLLGFLVKGEVDAIFDQHPFEPAEQGADVMELWRKSAAGRDTLSQLVSHAGKIETLHDEVAQVVEITGERRTQGLGFAPAWV